MLIIAKQGFEEEFKSLQEKKNSLNQEKEKAIQEALNTIEEKFSERGNLIDSLLSMVSERVEDSAEEIIENLTETPPPESTEEVNRGLNKVVPTTAFRTSLTI